MAAPSEHTSPPGSPGPRVVAALALVSVLGLALRLQGITYGLPEVYHLDEHFEVYRALGLGMGQFNFDRTGKGGYFYLLFVEYGLLYLWQRVTGAVADPQGFALGIVRDPSVVWLVGRLTSAAIAAVTLVLVWRVGRRLAGDAVGLLAALFLAVNAMHVEQSRFIVVDIPMVCLVTATLLFAVRIHESGRTTDYLWAGVLAAGATLCKLPAILLLPTLLAAHLLRTGPRGLLPARLGPVLAMTALFLVLYVGGNPGIVSRAADTFGGIAGMVLHGSAGREIPAETGARVNSWLFYLRAMGKGAGVAVLVAAVAALALIARARAWSWGVPVVFLLVFYGSMSLAYDPTLIYSRYMLPVMPVLSLLAAYAVVAGCRRLAGVRWPVAAAVAGLLLTVQPALAVQRLAHRMQRPDTRTVAKAWVEARYPAGTRVFVEGNIEENSQLVVPLHNLPENLERRAAELVSENPGKAAFMRMREVVEAGPKYDLVAPRRIGPVADLDTYLAQGVRLFIRRDPVDAAPPSGPVGPESVRGSRYRLDARLERDPAVRRVAVFDPADVGGMGPHLRIYEVVPAAEGTP